MEQFLKELRTEAESLGSDLFGVADLAVAHDFIQDQGGPVPASFPRALSLGMRLTRGVVDELFRHDDINVLDPYRGVYRTVNANLERAAILVATRLQQAGFRSYPIPAAGRTDSGRLCGAFSHKVAAYLAGLGWIGRCCLLITPNFGPRLRLTTFLTDAPLPARAPLTNHCGSCTALRRAVRPVRLRLPLGPARRHRLDEVRAFPDGRGGGGGHGSLIGGSTNALPQEAWVTLPRRRPPSLVAGFR